MQQKGYLWLPVIVLVALAVACGSDKPANPTTASSSATAASASSASDAVTLKVSAPTLTSPIGGVRLTTMDLTLTFQAATGTYVSDATFTYRVQLLDASSKLLEEKTGTGTTYAMSYDLEADTLYRWRVRAEMDGAVGPWSAVETFKSMEIPAGYIKGNEVYDPLTDGKTVGTVSGSVTWLPGVGVKLNGFESYIEYRLPTPCQTGEFSMIIGGVGGSNGGGKTKVMAMRQGLDDLITNDRRMTVESRNGVVAWRFITHDDQVDTVGSERYAPGISDDYEYLWTASFNGRFTVTIQKLPGMTTIYNFGKAYLGTYLADPHYAYVGAPIGRSGVTAGTVPGMIVRQVWLSPNPRPSWANK